MQPGVLLIRPHDQANPLEQALSEQGFRVFRQAVIETCAVAIEPEQWQQLADEYDGIVVVSPAAVGFFDEQLKAEQKAWPKGTYYCVGSGTAERLVPATHQPAIYPAPAHTADALIELDGLQRVEGQRWLFVTGREGRPLIAETLQRRGAKLDVLEVYERVPLQPDLHGPLSEWTEAVGIIVVTSQQQIELFWSGLTNIESADTWLKHCIWVVSSARLKKTLLSYDISESQITMAENAGRSALVRAVSAAAKDSTCTTSVASPPFANETKDVTMSKQDDNAAAPATPNEDDVSASEGTRKRAKSTASSPAPRRSVFSVFLTLLLLLSVITLGAGGYWAWAQQEEYRQETHAQLRELNERIDASDRAQEELRDGIFSQLDNQLSERFAQLEQERQRDAQALRDEAAEERRALREQVAEDRESMRSDFESQTGALQQLQAEVDFANLRVSEDLYLVEARDLALAAGRKLWLDYDRKTAIQLLERAEGLLADAGQNHVLPIRQQLRDDIEMLEGIEEQDLDALAIQVSAQRRRIRDLPMHSSPSFNDEIAQQEEGISSEFSEWRANLAKAWASFTDDFVRIQRTDELPALQIGQEQRALIVSQIELQLQIAQQALMQRQTVQYREALEQAAEWIAAYFDREQRAVQRTLQELEQLQGVDLDPSYPTRLLSEAMLRDAVDELLEGANR